MDQPVIDSKKILIVEDDELLSGIYLRRLQMEGFDTLSVANGKEALQAAVAYAPDLILLDLMLPGENGIDVLTDLRGNEVTKTIKVFVFSAIEGDGLVRESPHEKARVTEAGADEYFVKSRDHLDDVMTKIKETLATPQ